MNEKTVLVVDDSRVSRMMIKSFIKNINSDWCIVEADCGDDALQVTESINIDVMIIDYNMPGMDGIELFKKLKQRFPDAVGSLMTANIQSSIENKAREVGVGFEKKPITENKIKSILELGA